MAERTPRCYRHPVPVTSCDDCTAVIAARVAAARDRLTAAADGPCACRQCALNRQAAVRRKGARP